ncbi:hypothetical protein J437_LFUL008859 [Ladona fulva]|uniref:Uncharacterized protein n=1 Tax=Ladona fulva TaxID=123851 RepID=A0A8K0P160_LADFU|nr:hypothetical protein J437_LFUL008859 [Ladona fulva]
MERIELSEKSQLLPTAQDQGSGVHKHSRRNPHAIGAPKSVVETKPMNAKGLPNIRKRSKFEGPFDLLLSLVKNDLKLLKVIPSDVIKKCRYGSERVTPLIIASFACSVELVEALLESGVDVNDCDAAGRVPLLLAAACGRNEIVSELLKKGANPNLHDSGRHRESSTIEDLGWYKKEDEYMKQYNLEVSYAVRLYN